ncbi:MAG: hypothetical protein FWG12_04950 [Holophagaceae bacterium]|nr:hypothetical protein [Holophagaceae bacterium]
MGNEQSAYTSPETLTWGISYGIDAPSMKPIADPPLNGRLPGPNEALEALRQAEERRLAGVPGIPAEEVIEELERIVAENV